MLIEEFVSKVKNRIYLHDDYLEGDLVLNENKNILTIKLCGKVIIKITKQKHQTKLEVARRYSILFIINGDVNGKWIKVEYNDYNLNKMLQNIDAVFEKCIRDSVKETFGCCNSFIKCSDNKQCIHPNKKFARGCMYRQNLKKGLIFYGKNRNYPEKNQR